MREDSQNPDLVKFFVTHRSQLRQKAIKILGTEERADDVVQDAYLKILEASAVFAVKEPSHYVYRVVRNLAIDHYRRAKLEINLFITTEEERQADSGSRTPESISISRQELQIVARALETLPDRTRQAFELHRLGDCTQREIAELLGVSPTLVNFMIRDAMECCRDALRKGSGSD